MGEPITWLTSKETAERLGVDDSYIRRLCGQGEFRAVKKGYTWLIDPESVEEWRKQRMRKKQAVTQ